MKKRSQIKDCYKWKTSDIYADEKLLQKDIDFLRSQVEVIKSYKGRLNNKKTILEYFNYCDSLDKIEEKVGAYIYLNHSENLETQRYVELSNIIDGLGSQLAVAGSFEESELLSLGVEFLTQLAEDKDFANYRLSLMELIRNSKHILSNDEEMIVSKASSFMGGFSNVFDNIDALDVKFDDFDVDGKKYKVTNDNLSLYLENKDVNIRKGAFKSLYDGYLKFQNTISTNYIESVKVDKFLSDVYRYNNTLSMALNGDNLPTEIYTNLIKQVNNNVKYLHEYLKLRKKLLGLKELNYHDLAVSLSNYKKKYNYETMCDTMYDALNPLGDEYVGVVKHAVNNRWIDVYPNDGKDTGGYCLGVYGVHPYILLNTVDNQNSMFTLIHEMGHAMHSYLSDKTQPHQVSDYPIFLAEIASTTNEVLLIKHLYKKATDKKEKLYLLDKYLTMFRTTLFRQTMFSEFEDYAHKLVENNEPISKDILTKEYARLNKVYHGSAVKFCKEISYEWLRIPHFYRAYYVFKYATGITSAICIASKILKGESPSKLLEFLSSGGSDYPNEILKKIGVDLTTDEPYNEAFKEMKWAIDELKKLVK